MPKSFIGFVVFSFCVSAASVGDAQPARQPEMHWYFRAVYPTGQYGEGSDSTVSGPIIMYSGATWRCERVAASLNRNGNVIAGYRCISTGGAFVSVLAACSPTKEDVDVAQAGVGDSSGYVTLYASCSTKPVSPASPGTSKSVDKNL